MDLLLLEVPVRVLNSNWTFFSALYANITLRDTGTLFSSNEMPLRGRPGRVKCARMHREPLLQLIDRYVERHPGEADTGRRVKDFVVRNVDCFQRSLEAGHITGSAWIVDASGKRTLLTNHAKLNLWLQPGGHADGESDVLSVAMQECLEETGLKDLKAVTSEIFDLDVHGIPERKGEPSHFHYDIRFLLQAGEDEEYVVTDESHDLAWVDMGFLEDYTLEWSMRRMRDKAIRHFS